MFLRRLLSRLKSETPECYDLNESSGNANPDTQLGLNPEITTEADLQLAARAIGRIDGNLQKLDAEMQEAITLAKVAHDEDAALAIEGERVSSATYLERLQSAVVAFAKSRADFFLPGRQTVALPGATVAARKLPLQIAFIDSKEDALKAIEKALDLQTGLALMATEDALLAELLSLIRVKVEINLSAITEQAKAGRISEERLNRWGMKTVTGETAITCKPAKA